MLVNKSMYPVKAGYSAISTMQGQLGKLQTQLGDGQKAQTLAEMGSDRSVSLATRGRLTKLDSFKANIDTVNLRLNFLDQAMTAIGKLKSETRTSATPTSFGENNLTMVSLQQNSKNRLSQLLETLNTSVAGRYLMGGNKTDAPPVATYDKIMHGEGTSAGYLTVAGERLKADQGANSNDTLSNVALPRTTIRGPWENTLVISSAEFERFGYKIMSISGNSASTQTSGPTADPLAPTVQVTTQPAPGDNITFTMTRRDGSTATFTATAVANGTTPNPDATPPQYEIGSTLEQTAGNLEDLMGRKLGNLENFKVFSSNDSDVKVIGYSDGMDAISIKFDTVPADGEIITIGIKGPDGVTTDHQFKAVTGTADPNANPPEYQIGTSRKQAMANLQGLIGEKLGALDAPLKLGRLSATTTDTRVTIEEQATSFGYKLATGSTTSSQVNISATSGNPANMTVDFLGIPRAGESITLTLNMPDGTTKALQMQAVSREPVVGQFVIGSSAAETAANFEAALKLQLDDTSKTDLVAASTYAAADDFFTPDGEARRILIPTGPPGGAEYATDYVDVAGGDTPRATVRWYTGEVGTSSDNPRLSATAKVDDATKVGYGVRANETGLLEMVKTLAAMSIQEYDINDTTSKGRFSAMVERQMTKTSSDTATAKGSVESIALELGVVRATVGGAAARNTAFTGQLQTLLSDVETVTMEETVMQLLALKTRLEASYQTTASVANLSLVNYLK